MSAIETSFDCGFPTPLRNRGDATTCLLPILRKAETFLVTSHSRPDGDSVGSALAAMHLLELMGKAVTVAFADPVPKPFQVLPGALRVVQTLPPEPVDVALVLECDSVQRTGFSRLPAHLLINIDHHHSGTGYASANWIDPAAPAVGAMLYDLAIASGVRLTPDLASCLYAAVLTDTVCFTLPGVTAETFALASHLLELGADAAGISEAVYRAQPQSKLRVLGTVLCTMRVQGRVATGGLSRAEMERYDAGVEDSEGIVQHLISLDGVEAAALLRELPGSGDQLRVSLRSKGDVDVALVAESFGGGGHRNASGCSVAGPLETARALVEKALHAACDAARFREKGLVG